MNRCPLCSDFLSTVGICVSGCNSVPTGITVGTCPLCGEILDNGHMCVQTPEPSTKPTPHPGNPIIDPELPKRGMLGWTCPRCSRGNSPYTTTCPCIPLSLSGVTYDVYSPSPYDPAALSRESKKRRHE